VAFFKHLVTLGFLLCLCACGSTATAGAALSYQPLDGAASVGALSDQGAVDAAGSDAMGDTATFPEDTAGDDGTDAVDSADTDVASLDAVPGDTSVLDATPADVQIADATAACTGCDDGDPCTVDVCVGSACKHSAKPGCAKSTGACLTTCAAGVCDPVSHACVECIGTSGCGPAQVCQYNQCVATTACKSSIECKATQQVCDPAANACVDCTTAADCATGQACVEHACIAAPGCKSDKECAVVCDKAKGVCVDCLASSDCTAGTWCAPWHACVPALCMTGGCVGATVLTCKADGSGYQAGPPCSDGNVCTSDGCDAVKGCVFTAAPGPCSDGNPCTSGDACQGGGCVGQVDAKLCDDANVCTTDSCGSGGCSHASAPNGGPCSDGNPSTTGDVCSSGICKGKTSASGGCTSAGDQAYLGKLATDPTELTKLQDELYSCILSNGCFGKIPGNDRATCVAGCIAAKGVPLSSTCDLCWGEFADCASTHCFGQCVGGPSSSGCVACQNSQCGAAKDACFAGK
jgi:hypothetical protein